MTATLKSITQEDFSDEPFHHTQVLHYSRRGSTFLFTREASIIVKQIGQFKDGRRIAPKYEVTNAPIVRRLLLTDEFLAVWQDLSTPVVDLYRAADWKDAEKGHHRGILALTTAAEVNRFCFGILNPFYELFEQPPEIVRWEIDEQQDGNYWVSRTVIMGPGKTKKDLRLLLDARSGVMRRGEFSPGESVTQWEATYAKISLGDANLTVPNEVESVSLDQVGAPIESYSIIFDDFRNERDLRGYELADIGLPEGSTVRRQQPDARFDLWQWKGGELLQLVDE